MAAATAVAEAGTTATDATAKDLMEEATRDATMTVVTAQKLKPAAWRYAVSAYCLSHEGHCAVARIRTGRRH